VKIKLNRADTYWLEDVLLDIYHGLPVASLEGDERLARIVNKIQDTVYEEDIQEDIVE